MQSLTQTRKERIPDHGVVTVLDWQGLSVFIHNKNVYEYTDKTRVTNSYIVTVALDMV